MSNLSITGKVLKVGSTKSVSASFQKRTLLVETSANPEYSSPVLFEATQQRTDLLDAVKEGDTATVHFNMRGREWVSPQGETKYFTSLQIWKVEVAQSTQPVAATQDDLGDLF